MLDRLKNRSQSIAGRKRVAGRYPYRESFEEDQALYDAFHRISG